MDGAIGLSSTSAAVRAGFPVTGPREVGASEPARSPRAAAAAPASPPSAASSAPLADLADGASLTSRQFGLAIGPFTLRYVSERLDISAAADRGADATASSVVSGSSAGLSTEASADAASETARQAPAGGVVRDADFNRLLREMARNRRSGRQFATSRSGEAAISRSASSASEVRSFVAGDSGGSSRTARRRGVAAYQAQLAAPDSARSGAALSLTV